MWIVALFTFFYGDYGYPFDVESSHLKCFTSAVTFKDCLVNMVMDYVADCELRASWSK